MSAVGSPFPTYGVAQQKSNALTAKMAAVNKRKRTPLENVAFVEEDVFSICIGFGGCQLSAP
jgi:hypothetical protein